MFRKITTKQFLIVFTVLILLLRISQFSYVTEDYTLFLQYWVRYIQSHGYFFAFQESFANYNYPYLIFLVIISAYKVTPIYLIKLLSTVFDFGIAIVGTKIVEKCIDKRRNVEKAKVWTYVFLLASPVIMSNSAIWGQCDSIYSFFVLCAIYFLMDSKVFRSFLFLSIAFAMKLQTIFVLPVYIILLFCDKRVKFYYFFLIPIVNFVLCIPAYLAGGSIFYTYETYFGQVETSYKTMNSINYYKFFEVSKPINLAGGVFTVCIFAILFFLFVLKKQKFNNSRILSLSLLSVSICFYFLPCMHERYSYCVDILSALWFFSNYKRLYVMIVMNLCSYINYINYFLDNTSSILPSLLEKGLSFAYLFCIIVVLYETCKPLITKIIRTDFLPFKRRSFRVDYS